MAEPHQGKNLPGGSGHLELNGEQVPQHTPSDFSGLDLVTGIPFEPFVDDEQLFMLHHNHKSGIVPGRSQPGRQFELPASGKWITLLNLFFGPAMVRSQVRGHVAAAPRYGTPNNQSAVSHPVHRRQRPTQAHRIRVNKNSFFGFSSVWCVYLLSRGLSMPSPRPPFPPMVPSLPPRSHVGVPRPLPAPAGGGCGCVGDCGGGRSRPSRHRWP